MAILTVYTKLLDKTLDGPRIIDMGSTKTCQCYVLPYDKVAKVSKEFLTGKYAFYILLGNNELGQPMAYIGQTNDFSVRANDHKQKKDWWDTALVFVSKAAEIFASEVLYLEYIGWKRATEVKHYKIANNKIIKEPGLSEDKKNDMELFFEEIHFLTLFYGCTVFEEPTFTKQEEMEHTVFYMKKAKVGIDAVVYFYPVTKTFVLKAGSKIRYNPLPTGSKEAHLLREEIKANTALSKKEGDLLVILQDIDITSNDRTPSGATCVINGGSDRGTTSLEDKDGKTFEQLFLKG
jgi:hypothetical protein